MGKRIIRNEHFTGTSLINQKGVDKTTGTSPGKKPAHNEVTAKTKEIKKPK